jgi:hypothetical protein
MNQEIMRAIPDEALPLIASGLVRLETPREGPAPAWVNYSRDGQRYTICVLESLVGALSDEALRSLVQHEFNHVVLNHRSAGRPCAGLDMRLAVEAEANWYLERDGRFEHIVDELARVQEIDRDNAGLRSSAVLQRAGLDPAQPHRARTVHARLHSQGPWPDYQVVCGGVHSSERPKDINSGLTRVRLAATPRGPAVRGADQVILGGDPVPGWAEEVARLIEPMDYVLRQQRRYSRPHQTLLQTGLYVPSEKPTWDQAKPAIAVLIDVSGSMWWEGQVLAGVEAAVHRILERARVRFIAGDVRVTFDDEIIDGFPDEVPGGGGTNLLPLFERADQYDPSAAVCLTDASVPGWPEQPPYPVVWVVPGHSSLRPPWGTVICYTEAS